jgi:hypothetical protein
MKRLGGTSFPPLSVIAALVLGGSLLLPPGALPDLGGCWMRNLLEVPCPACGLTHGILAIGHGRFAEAWTFNPFSFLFYLLAVILVLKPLLPGSAVRSTGVFLRKAPWALWLVGGMFGVWLFNLTMK